MDYDKLKAWGETLEKEYGGVRAAGKTPVLPPGYSLKSVGTISAVDLQLVELLKWGVEDLARVWNYNPWLLSIITSGTVPKMQEQIEHFARFTFQPWVNLVKSALTFNLMSPLEKADGYAIDINTDLVRSGTWLDQMNAADLAATRGAILTPNEVRRRLRHRPLPGEENDKLRSPKGSPDMRQPPDNSLSLGGDRREADSLLDKVPTRGV